MKHILSRKYLTSILCAAIVTLTGFSGCHFVESFSEEERDDTTLSVDKGELTLKSGAMDTISLSVSQNQSGAGIRWEYDDKLIKCVTDNYGAVITGLSAGQTQLKAVYGGNGATATCLITVTGDTYVPKITNPYVYASRDYVSLVPKQRVRISGSLFGGTPSETGGFTWSIDKPSVASLSTEGNCCWITGLSAGTAKITLRHSKSSYPYSVLIDVIDDGTNVPYITTENNIVTIALDTEDAAGPKANITAEIKNSFDSDISKYNFAIVDKDGNPIVNDAPVVISETSGNICGITAREFGECFVRITHPDTPYPLDVFVRVLKHSDGSYIELSDTMLFVSGNTKHELKAFIADTKEGFDPDKFKWSFTTNSSLYADWSILNGNGTDSGNVIEFTGKRTGTFRCNVTYPGLPERSAVIVVRDIEAESSKATTYISTDQNFISLTEGEDCTVNVRINDCDSGDFNNLMWNLVSYTQDSYSGDVIRWIEGNGYHESKIKSRSARSAAALTYSESASCRIEAIHEGHSVIEISHPKALYSTKIDVLVKKPKTKAPDSCELMYDSAPLIAVKNGTTETIKIKREGDGADSSVVWHIEEGVEGVTFSPNGLECAISAPDAEDAPGKNFTVWAEYPGLFDGRISFRIYTYATESDLEAITFKSFYTTQSLSITADSGKSVRLRTILSGGSETDTVSWSSSDTSVCEIEYAGRNEASVFCSNPGTAVITASCEELSDIKFTIKVNDSRFVPGAEDVWLSTSNNVLYFDSEESASQNVSVQIHGMNAGELTKWTCSDPEAFSVTASGLNASITPLKAESTALVTVTHPYAVNSIEINLRTGKLYEYNNPDSIYIEPSVKKIDLYSGQKEVLFSASLASAAGSGELPSNPSFTFTARAEDASVIKINHMPGADKCFISPVSEGKALITIHCDDAQYDCEVPVIVKIPDNFTTLPYLTTDRNQITILEGDMEPVTVSAINVSDSDFNVMNKWKWQNEDGTEYARAVAQTGGTAMVTGIRPGIQKITISHDDCPYPLEITVTVLSAQNAFHSPYIKTSQNIITLTKGKSTTVTAEVVNGSADTDNSLFSWTLSDTANVLINPSENSCFIKALNSGTSRITVRNSRYPSSYTREILVIVEDEFTDSVAIKSSVSTLKLSPKDRNLTVIRAELDGGTAVDAADFIWWADDYSLLMLSSVADECSITPKGQAGTTYVHVKHPKSPNILNILVMISEYSEFEFAVDSMKMRAGHIYFVPMHVPVTDSDFTVEYESPDTDICWASGSNGTAYIAARHAGTVGIHAVMKTSEGREMASAQLLVNIVEDDVVIPDITAGNSCIFEMTEGDDMTLSAMITGGGISEGEKYALNWEITGGQTGGLLFTNTGMGSQNFTGADAVITAVKGGTTMNEYVIRISHPATGAETFLCVKVAQRGQREMKLSTYYEKVYKSDGTFKITAELLNCRAGEEKNITWSSVRSNGVNVVSVTKTKGPTCTVTPKAEGMTQVVARLPDGLQKTCEVIVMPEATIKLQTGNIHVMPGETREVSYYTEPASCTINWLSEMNGGTSSFGGTIDQYFSFEVNEAEKKLFIRGEKVCDSHMAGTIKGMMTSTRCNVIPQLNVFVDYDRYMEVTYADKFGNNSGNVVTVLNNDVTDKKALKLNRMYFYVKHSPSLLELQPLVISDETIVKQGAVSTEVITDSSGNKTRISKVELIPITEGECTIKVCVKHPDVDSVREEKVFNYHAYYADYTAVVSVQTGAGAFSKYKDGYIDLSDGEEMMLTVNILNEGAKGSVDGLVYVQKSGTNEAEFMPNGKYRLDDTRVNQEKDSGLKDDSNGNKYDYRARPVGAVYPDGYNGRKPGVSLISLDKVSGSDGSYWRIAHNFDYYKDLPDVSSLGKTTSMSGSEITDYADLIHNNTCEYWVISNDMIWRKHNDDGIFNSSTKLWNNKGIVNWNIINGERDAGKGREKLDYLKIYPTFQHRMPANNSCLSTYFKYSKTKSLGSVSIPSLSITRSNDGGAWSGPSDSAKPDNLTMYAVNPESYEVYYEGSSVNNSINNYKNVDVNSNDYSPIYVYLTSGQTGKLYELGTYNKNLPRYSAYYTSTYTTEEYGNKNIGQVTYRNYKDPIPDGVSVWSHYRDFTTPSNKIKEGREEYYYERSSNTLRYPQNINEGTFTPYNKTEDSEYLFVEYININKPYIITNEDLKNNPNYYFDGGSYSVENHGEYHKWGDYYDINRETVTIRPTLMHEHVVPCICPDSTPVEGWDKRDIGTVNVRYTLAKGGQATGDGANIKSIPVKITKRNCEAYQSNKWKSQEVQDAYNDNKYYTYYVKQ